MPPDAERRPNENEGTAPKSTATTTSHSLQLAAVVPSGGRPKGLVSYRPSTKTKVMVERILDLYDRMDAADALPLGPRAAGYRLKESYVGVYTKADFPTIETTIKRLQQAGQIPWTWVSDASSLTYTTDGWGSPADFLRDAHDLYERDLRDRQPTVVEIYTEAKETLPLIARIGAERGVTVYSGQVPRGRTWHTRSPPARSSGPSSTASRRCCWGSATSTRRVSVTSYARTWSTSPRSATAFAATTGC